jgi:hypothetical protein
MAGGPCGELDEAWRPRRRETVVDFPDPELPTKAKQ